MADTTNPPSTNTPSTPDPNAVAGGNTPTPSTESPTPVDDGGDVPCDLGSGSPSFMGSEGAEGGAGTPGSPVPPAAGLRPTNKEYITNQSLPPIPTNVNFNNAARNIKLSYYFTLHDLLHPALGAASIPMGGKTVGGHFYSAHQLVQNLRDLCVLCLDPIKHRWRNMTLTSTLRNKTNGSAHNVGWAADMQFSQHGKTGGQLRGIAEQIAAIPGITYDQLLYEYPSDNRNTWIHIGLRQPANAGAAPRGWAQSFFYGNYPNDSRKRMLGARGTFQQMPGLNG